MSLDNSLDSRGLMWIPLASILEHCDPTVDNPWGCGTIDHSDVLRAVELGAINRESAVSPDQLEDYDWNVGRIAYFVAGLGQSSEVDFHPICIDVGLEGYTPAYMLIDGNHRVAAAKILGDEQILVSIGGDWDKAKAVLLDGVHPDDYVG